MKLPRIIFALCAFLPCLAQAQDVRVRLYALHPPAELTATAVAGTLRWGTCSDCLDNPAGSVTLKAVGAELRISDSGVSKQLYLIGAYRLVPADSPPFSGNFPLEIQAREGHLLLTLAMPAEDYVAAVLAGESGGFQNNEAMKAMAIAVRTYAARFRGQHAADGFDFCDTTHCQVPRWNDINSRVRAALDATRGEILWFGGAPASTHYHQNCGGAIAASTEAWPTAKEPYLRNHPDPYCAASAPLKWESTISIGDLDAALHAASLSPPPGWTALEVVSRSHSGRAQRLRFLGGASTDTLISASSFRFAVDRALGWNKIRSDLYEIRNAGDHLIFSGRGSGHGVGMCQAGVEEMAREGKDYRQILSFYYPGTQLATAPADQWRKRITERFELVSTTPENDSGLLPAAERILKENEAAVGWHLSFRVRLQIFPTLDRYRDTTGQPGWVAATTRDRTIRLQPLAQLRKKSILESTLRHELYHLLIESHAHSDIPLWFREGLVLYLSDPVQANSAFTSMTDHQMEGILRQPHNREEVEKAYAAVRARVASLIEQNGKKAVLEWLTGGIPGRLLSQPAPPTDHGASEHPRR